MISSQEWIWNVIVCPVCGSKFEPSEKEGCIACSNSECRYQMIRTGKIFNLLPEHLDQYQIAENDYHVKIRRDQAEKYPQFDEDHLRTFQLMNVATHHSYASIYQYFRDSFSKRYHFSGHGLELGGGAGQLSSFIKLFFPDTQMVMTDVAPANVAFAEQLSTRLGMEIDWFLVVDAERLPVIPESFDFLVSSGMLHHLGDLNQGLLQGYQALRPGGRWYILNELSIGPLPRLYWNSRFGKKGRWAQQYGIRENSYTLKEWRRSFLEAGFELIEMQFHTDPKYKQLNWFHTAYYAMIHYLPKSFLRLGIPCEVHFVLEKGRK